MALLRGAERLDQKGADKIAPSTRQNVIVSSNVRLQVGQLFILVSRGSGIFSAKNNTERFLLSLSFQLGQVRQSIVLRHLS